MYNKYEGTDRLKLKDEKTTNHLYGKCWEPSMVILVSDNIDINVSIDTTNNINQTRSLTKDSVI